MKATEPAVSVCMPVYNAARYLTECIDSILAQTFTDFELLIVDDGSTDNSRDIVRSYHDKRIRLIENRHDYIGSLNKLLDEAKGKYIARMDADDVMKPDRLAVQFGYMEQHHEVTVVGGRFQIIGKEKDEQNNAKPTEEVTMEMLVNFNTVAHPTVMMRKEDIKRHNLLYNREFIYAEDYKLWLDTLHAGLRIVNIANILIAYRMSDGQVTAKYRNIQGINSNKIQQQAWEIVCRTPVDITAEQDQEALPPLPGNKLTIIMPFLNEGEEVGRTLQSIYNHAGKSVEIIVINDCSDDNFDYAAAIRPYRATYIVNKKRKGVAACRDIGVSLCKTPYFLLLDAHMRFYDGLWPKRISDLLEKDERVLLCCQTRLLQKDKEGNTIENKEGSRAYGAYIPFRDNSFWPDIEWNYHELRQGQKTEPIACVLGAGYAASKQYWLYLKGLEGLRKYGSDEAFISLKVWREGGKCLLIKDIVIGHIYRSISPYKHYKEEEVTNNLLISYLTFSQSWYCLSMAIAYKKDKSLYEKSIQYLSLNKPDIAKQKEYLSSIYTVDFEDILYQHKHIALKSCYLKKNDSVFAQINEFIIQHPAKEYGLYEGLSGQLLWFCHYKRWGHLKSLDPLIKKISTAIEQKIFSHTLTWNFSQGICGIGWMYVYLYAHQLIDNNPENILRDIDFQIQEIAFSAIPVNGIAEGVSGILAYAAIRTKTGNPQWRDTFITKLKDYAKQILSNSEEELPSLFYAIFCLDLFENGTKEEKYLPRTREWLKLGQHLPVNSKYWNPILADGCIGAVISLMER